MKKTQILAAILLGLVGLTSAHAAGNTITNSVTVDSGITYVNLDFPKFDLRLGTLTGVTVTVDFSTLQGSFALTNQDALANTVSGVTGSLYLKSVDASTVTGFASSKIDLGSAAVDPTVITTTPDWQTAALPTSDTVTFTIGSGQDFVTDFVTNIPVGKIANYASADGTGVVSFQAKETNNVAIQGAGEIYTVTVNTSNMTAKTKMTVAYTYAPTVVPEPTTWVMLMGGIGMLALGQRFRRRA